MSRAMQIIYMTRNKSESLGISEHDRVRANMTRLTVRLLLYGVA